VVRNERVGSEGEGGKAVRRKGGEQLTVVGRRDARGEKRRER